MPRKKNSTFVCWCGQCQRSRGSLEEKPRKIAPSCTLCPVDSESPPDRHDRWDSLHEIWEYTTLNKYVCGSWNTQINIQHVN